MPDWDTKGLLSYAAAQYMGDTQYQKLGYPYRDLALLSYAVLPDSEVDTDHIVPLPALKEISADDFSFPCTTLGHNYITRTKDGYHIGLESEMTVHVPLPDAYEIGDTLFLSFQLTNNKKHRDVSITFDDSRQSLSSSSDPQGDLPFTVTPGFGQKILNFTFSPGNYMLSDIRCFSGPLKSFQNPGLIKGTFTLDSSGLQSVSGTISCREDAYFISALPYRKDFCISIDGSLAAPLKVNQSCLGFRLPKGEHTIRIFYMPACAITGRLLFFSGIFLLYTALFYCFRHPGPKPCGSSSSSV